MEILHHPQMADDTFIYSFICPFIYLLIYQSITDDDGFIAFESVVDDRCAANVPRKQRTFEPKDRCVQPNLFSSFRVETVRLPAA